MFHKYMVCFAPQFSSQCKSYLEIIQLLYREATDILEPDRLTNLRLVALIVFFTQRTDRRTSGSDQTCAAAEVTAAFACGQIYRESLWWLCFSPNSYAVGLGKDSCHYWQSGDFGLDSKNHTTRPRKHAWLTQTVQ